MVKDKFSYLCRLFNVLVVVTILGFASPTAEAGAYSGGTGEPNDPYLISTAEDLNALGDDPNDWSKHFLMTEDINMAGYTFTTAVIAPDINNANSTFDGMAFTGSFDGNGYAIKNLVVYDSGLENDYLALFGYVDGPNAHIKNLGLRTGSISGGNNSFELGSLVAYNNGGYISSCYSKCSVSGYLSVGGLVGTNYHGVLLNCFAEGPVTGEVWTGGLLGKNYGIVMNCRSRGLVTGFNITGGLVGQNLDALSNCFATGSVIGNRKSGGLVGGNRYGLISSCYATGSVTGQKEVGGLVGIEQGTTSNCYAIGSVTGNDGVGGFIGLFLGGTTTNCYATGRVDGNSNTGGFSGSTFTYAYAFNCFWDVQTTNNTNSALATGLTTAQMQTLSTFINANWDFIGESANGIGEIWHMPDGGGYPELSFFDMEPPILLEGSGTESDPYLIDIPEKLGMIKWYSINACFELVEDINLSDINNSEAVIPVFEGIFNGNEHMVSNLSISGGGYLGFFGYLGASSLVRNISLQNISINSPGICVGGLVGFNNKGELENCSATGSLTGGTYCDFFGGLVGYNNWGKVSNCYTVSSVLCNEITAYHIGGLMGRNHYGEVYNCYAKGSVAGDEGIGGLVGYNWGGTIANCYATSSVRGGRYSDFIGGFLGSNYKGSVLNSYSTGTVAGNRNLGGFTGGGTASNCFWDIQTSDISTSKGGIGKTTLQMQTKSTFTDAGWDFNTPVWTIWEGVDYPRLCWETNCTANTEPVACVVGRDRVIETGVGCEAQIVLDGSCSSDEDSTAGTNDDINDFDWYEVIDACDPNSDIYIGSGEVIECNLGLGENVIILEVTDKAGAFDSNEVVITVEDVTLPEFSLTVEPNVLWPPNGKMVLVRPEWEVNDNCDEEVEVSLVDITMSVAGDINNYVQIGDEGLIYLRARKGSGGSGRIYTLTYEAVDDSGNVTEKSTTAAVRHSK